MSALRDALNPVSTGFTRWWCHSSLRAILSGKPRHFYRRGEARLEPLDSRVRSRN